MSLRRPARRARLGGLTRRAAPLLALFAVVLACATVPRTEHTVQEGENLYRISAYYRVPLSDVVDANRIDDVTDLQPGRVLVIPGTDRPAPGGPLRPPAGLRPSEDSPLLGDEEPWVQIGDLVELRLAAQQEARAAGNEFHWPIRGRLSSLFGRRGRSVHRGIDIAARAGSHVRAAEAGRVAFSGRNGSYGRLVILAHPGGFRTWYAHNRKNHVDEGDVVARGEVIAEVGSTGNASGPHLHFEIRQDRRPRDPLLFLLDAR